MTITAKLCSLTALLICASTVIAQSLPATIIVNLPLDANLFVEGEKCPIKGGQRKFSTPAVELGVKYEYLLSVEVEHDGKYYGATQRIALQAGDSITVNFGDEKWILTAAGGVQPETTPKVNPKESSCFCPSPSPLKGKISRNVGIAHPVRKKNRNNY